MNSPWMAMGLLALVGMFVWFAVLALRTRDAGAPRETFEAARVGGHVPGMHSIDSEESLRARGLLPPR